MLLLLPVVGLLAWSRLRGGLRALDRALSATMAARLTQHLSLRRRAWGLAAMLGALFFLTLAVARPQRGTQYATAARRGIDVIVALDVSESMLAEDLKPNRLVRARHEISAILDRLKGDRVGLIAFAGAAFVQCPLTLDYAAARMFLNYMGPELIPEPGTNLADAVRVATRAFESEEAGFRALVLISDGEDHTGGLDEALDRAREADVRVFTVGIGNESGEPIPVRDDEGQITGYKKDREGKVVLTRLNEAPLRQLAERTGGAYVRAAGSLGLDRVLAEIDAMEKRELQGGVRVLYEERYSYFVWPALLLLLAQWWIPLRRRGHSWAGGGRTVAPLLVLAALGLAAASPGTAQQPVAAPVGAPPAAPPGAMAPGSSPAMGPAAAVPYPVAPSEVPPEERLSALIEENQVRRARDPDDPRPLYNLGTLEHLQGGLEQAQEYYGVASNWAEGELGARVAYNLGNTLYRLGRLEEARDAFARAVGFDPDFEDAKVNLELTQRALDRMQSRPDSTAQQSPGDSTQDQQDSEEQQKSKQQDPEQQNPEQQERQPQDRQQPQRDPESEDDAQQQPRDQQQDSADQQQQGQDQEQRERQQQSQQEEQEQPPQQESEEQQSAQSHQESAADSTLSAQQMQLMQILKGLEASERELLESRFQARSRNLNVEKDW